MSMQHRIQNSCTGSRERRAAVRERRDELLAAVARGQSVGLDVEDELYVLRDDGRTVRVQTERRFPPRF